MKKILTIIGFFMAMSVFASCSYSAEKPLQKNQSTMKITIGNQVFNATLANNATAEAFKKRLPLTLEMSDYGGFEKIATIDNLPTADKRENSLDLGDLMLYSGNTLVLFYAQHGGYSYTRIGKIDNPEGLKKALEGKKVIVKMELLEN